MFPGRVQMAATCTRRLAFIALLSLAAGVPACHASPGALEQGKWVGSWASAQQIPEPRNALPPGALDDATLRQVIRPSLGGHRIRLRVSNVYGTAPMAIGSMSIARSADPAASGIREDTSMPVTFSGEGSATVPAGAYLVSDPLEFAIEPLEHLAVSMHFPKAPEQQTGHPGSRATSWVQPGNHVAAPSLPEAESVDHWYQLSGLDVEAAGNARALIVIGDSITDGFGVSPNTDRRWTDFLVARVREDADLRDEFAVLNVGLGGNRLLLDGLGPNGLARFDRDVLGRPGASHVIVLLGVNDLGTLSKEKAAHQTDHDALVHQLIAAYRQMISRARENDVCIIGGTIMPFAGSGFYPSNEMTEASRRKVNAWIRQPGNFDAVIDFDELMRSTDDPRQLNPAYDSGDHLHPSIAGYEAMAAFVPLDLFRNPD